MTLNKSLTKFGNSYGLILDKPILELLNIGPDTCLNISTEDGKSLIIKPVNKNIRKAFEETNDTYQQALKKLAE